MKYAKHSIYLISTLIFIWISWFSFTIFTSLISERLPWHDGNGYQFVSIWKLSCPVMFGVGASHLILSRFMSVGASTWILPFSTGGIIGALVLVDGSLGNGMQAIGTTVCMLAALFAIVFAYRDLIAERKPNKNCHHSSRNR